MRLALVLVLLVLALFQAAIDWRATIGAGYAYRLTSIGGVLRERSPGAAEWLVEHAPWFWSLLAVLPLALLLAGLAALLWLTRRRRR